MDFSFGKIEIMNYELQRNILFKRKGQHLFYTNPGRWSYCIFEGYVDILSRKFDQFSESVILLRIGITMDFLFSRHEIRSFNLVFVSLSLSFLPLFYIWICTNLSQASLCPFPILLDQNPTVVLFNLV